MSFAKERTGEWTKYIKDTCRLCKTGKGSVGNNRFCYVCKDTFCELHVDDHSCLGQSETVYISRIDKVHTIRQKLLCCREVVCKCNDISPVSVYCYAEKDVICKGCSMQSHMGHTTVSIVKKCASYKKAKLSAVILRAKKLYEENKQLLNERQTQIKLITALKENAKRNIKIFGTVIIKHFDLKEQAILQDLETHVSEYKQAIKRHVEMCTNLEKTLQNDLVCLNNIQCSNYKPDMFATDLIISRRLASTERDLKYMQSPSLAFRRGEHLISLLTRVQKLGDSLKEADRESLKERVISGTEIDPSQRREMHPCCKRQHMRHRFVFPMRKLDYYEKHIYARACTIMNDGKVALISIDRQSFDTYDCDNAYVVLLDKSLDFLGQLELPSEPHDISVVNESSVIITLPNMKQLQYINVESGQLKPGRILQMDNSYFAVEVVGKSIYSTYIEYGGDGNKYMDDADKAEVQILSLDGKVQKRFAYKEGDDGFRAITEPLYLTVDASTERIFVSDRYMLTVTCLKIDGTVMFQCISYCRAICICNENDVAILRDCEIRIFSNTGKILSTIDLVHEDNKYARVRAESMAYNKQTDTFVLGCHTDERYCFTMTQNKFHYWWSYLG